MHGILRPILLQMALAVLTFLTVLGSGELYFRYIDGRFIGEPDMIRDPDLGWVPLQARFNAIPDPQAVRIVALGDSFTEGASKPGLFLDLLRNRTPGCSKPLQILNLGVRGFGQAQEWMMWQRYGVPFQPAHVLLFLFLWNDLPDNLNDIYYSPLMNINRPEWDPDTATLVNRSNDRVLPGWLTDQSYLARYLEVKFGFQLRGRLYWTIAQYRDFYVDPPGPRAARAFRATEKLLLAMRDSVAARGADLTVVAFDNAFSVEEAVRDSQKKLNQGVPRQLFWPVGVNYSGRLGSTIFVSP
ncbi:MAG: hypothetical protein HQL82_08670, partial [Magnetococcales bacterium]|nr:hypothetical protein [Magnetococcales bacterium]